MQDSTRETISALLGMLWILMIVIAALAVMYLVLGPFLDLSYQPPNFRRGRK